MNQICLLCKQTSTNTKLKKLNTIKHMLINSSIQPSKKNDVFVWGINIRCKYGISCPQIHKMNSDAKMIAKQIEPYLITIMESDNIEMYHRTLQLMRGDFPSIYSKMERAYNANKHKLKQNIKKGE